LVPKIIELKEQIDGQCVLKKGEMYMNTLPKTPKALLNRLFVIFPQYRFNYDDYGPIYHGPLTYHSVLIEFKSFFRTEAASLTEIQLSNFRKFVSESVSKAGPLKSALRRCLEHQLR
jgi:hypothetical protein